MPPIALIGGTGLGRVAAFEVQSTHEVETPYGLPSAPITRGRLYGREVLFLPRHGDPHRIPPHRVNYRANLWALQSLGAQQVLAAAAVGGIGEGMGPGALILPDQIIDYTYGRAHTFFDEGLDEVTHIDFTQPYSKELRQVLIESAARAGVALFESGTYGATQGPRLETAQEIRRLAQDGCHLVGMTGMPEAALARELGLGYACCAVVANWAAGLDEGEITMAEIEHNLKAGMVRLLALLEAALPRL